MAQPQTLETRIQSLLDQSRARNGVTRLQILAVISAAAAAMIPLATIRLDAAEKVENAGGANELALGTPEGAVKTFIAAINRGDLRTAASCVVGGRTDGISAEFEQFVKATKPQITLEGVRAEAREHEATVRIGSVQVAVAANAGGGAGAKTETQTLGASTVKAHQEGGTWKIVPAAGGQPEAGGILNALLTEVTVAPGESSPARARAALGVCLSNLRQLGLAALTYASQHEDRFNFPEGNVKKALLPFLENNERLFAGASDTGKPIAFVFNAKLLNGSLVAVAEPSRTVLFYEAAAPAEELHFAHNNRAAVAFVDGHVQAVSKVEALELRWQP